MLYLLWKHYLAPNYLTWPWRCKSQPPLELSHPAHCGVPGNEIAEQIADAVHDRKRSSHSYRQRVTIQESLMKTWQEKGDFRVLNRADQVVIPRLRSVQQCGKPVLHFTRSCMGPWRPETDGCCWTDHVHYSLIRIISVIEECVHTCLPQDTTTVVLVMLELTTQ